MKKYLLFIIGGLLSTTIYCQKKTPPPPPPAVSVNSNEIVDNKIFTQVDIEAAFTGGDTAWRNYLIKNLDIDKVSNNVKMKKKQKVLQQTAIVKFVVCTDGSLCDIDVENNIDPAIKAEAIRVIKLSPNWQPAKMDDKNVKAYRRQPITFRIEVE
jgi:periplasmic protein TonB